MPPTERTEPFMRTPVAVAGVVIAVALAACSSSAQVASGESSPTPSQSSARADVETYTSEKYGFSFEYAAPFEPKEDTSWDAGSGASTADSVAVFDTEGTQVDGQYRDAFVVNVYELTTQITQENLAAVEQELQANVLPQLEQSTEDMQISGLTATTVGGLDGFQADATFTVDGIPMTSRLYFLFDGDIEYQLLSQAAADRWEQLQPTFDDMAASFTVPTAVVESTGVESPGVESPVVGSPGVESPGVGTPVVESPAA